MSLYHTEDQVTGVTLAVEFAVVITVDNVVGGGIVVIVVVVVIIVIAWWPVPNPSHRSHSYVKKKSKGEKSKRARASVSVRRYAWCHHLHGKENCQVMGAWFVMLRKIKKGISEKKHVSIKKVNLWYQEGCMKGKKTNR